MKNIYAKKTQVKNIKLRHLFSMPLHSVTFFIFPLGVVQCGRYVFEARRILYPAVYGSLQQKNRLFAEFNFLKLPVETEWVQNTLQIDVFLTVDIPTNNILLCVSLELCDLTTIFG